MIFRLPSSSVDSTLTLYCPPPGDGMAVGTETPSADPTPGLHVLLVSERRSYPIINESTRANSSILIATCFTCLLLYHFISSIGYVPINTVPENKKKILVLEGRWIKEWLVSYLYHHRQFFPLFIFATIRTIIIIVERIRKKERKRKLKEKREWVRFV